MSRRGFVIGIDEVGRGALAGPVVIAAVAIPKRLNLRSKKRARLKDSKRLVPRAREVWFDYICEHPKISYTLARVTPGVIDRVNIAQAANRAATRAFKKLNSKFYILNSRVYLDGGLYLLPRLPVEALPIRQAGLAKEGLSASTLTKGDEKINAIKLASIVAKVTRDRYMIRLHKKHPQYSFHEHKGYGTKKHKRAIKKCGRCQAHRLSFIANKV